MSGFTYFAADSSVMDRAPFNVDEQNGSTDLLLVAALERVTEAFRVMLWEQAKAHGLSPIQVRVLLFLNGHSEEMATLTYLAKEFNVAKATMSEVVKVLTEKKLVQKKDNAADTRTQLLKITPQGKKMAAVTGGFANQLLPFITNLNHQRQLQLKELLLEMIFHLYKEGVVTTQRMCFACKHYDAGHDKAFCNLLKIPLLAETLRMDCPEYEPAPAV